MKKTTKLFALITTLLLCGMTLKANEPTETLVSNFGVTEEMSFESEDTKARGGAAGWWENATRNEWARTTEKAYDGNACMRCVIPATSGHLDSKIQTDEAGGPNSVTFIGGIKYKLCFYIFIDDDPSKKY